MELNLAAINLHEADLPSNLKLCVHRMDTIGILVDSEIDLSTRNGNARTFIC
jgi:hypothetical protein